MIESYLIKGIQIPQFDVVIEKVLDNLTIEGGGSTMVVGIENLEGDVYRKILATGMAAYMHLVEDLKVAGFKDLLAESIFGEGGFDSRFVATNEVIEATDPATAFDELLANEHQFSQVSETEREQIIRSRLGQGSFRKSLVEYWNGCAVTECKFIPLLRASHIKPWADASNEERLDYYNGLLLAPNLDAAFDAGFISFEDNGKIIISDALSNNDAYALRITSKLKLRAALVSSNHEEYLEYHRTQVLRR